MNMFTTELAQAAQRVQIGNHMPGGGSFNSDGVAGMPEFGSTPFEGIGKPPGLEKFSHQQILKFSEMLKDGKMPPELAPILGNMKESGLGPDGKPIPDAEGGVMIQPDKGFVVKTQAEKVGKVFMNMCSHDVVEPFETKAVPKEQAEQHGTSERGLRIPLSMGERREEHDKKGEACMVIDVIWSPQTIAECLKSAQFRQCVIELAFDYVNQKYGIQLDIRFTIPKLKYKGATVQYQRVKQKKAPKIQEVEMTQKERDEFERKGLEEQKLKDALKEKTPNWKLYCHLRQSNFDNEFWLQQIDQAFEEAAGDEKDRWTSMQETFQIKTQLDVCEEFDGVNHEEALSFVLVIDLPMLVRGHSISTRVLDDIISMRVTNLYKFQLGLPRSVIEKDCKSFFDCKLRKLIVTIPVKQVEAEAPVEQVIAAPEAAKPITAKPVIEEPDNSTTDDLLFDVV